MCVSGYTEKEVSGGMSPEEQKKEDQFAGYVINLISFSGGDLSQGVFINNGELWPKASFPNKLK